MTTLKATAAHQSAHEHVRDLVVPKLVWTVRGLHAFRNV